jgi:hypothetical protein
MHHALIHPYTHTPIHSYIHTPHTHTHTHTLYYPPTIQASAGLLQSLLSEPQQPSATIAAAPEAEPISEGAKAGAGGTKEGAGAASALALIADTTAATTPGRWHSREYEYM